MRLAINKNGGTANTSNGQASTVVLDSSDVVVGRTYRLEITAPAASGASDIDVSYTAVTGDDAQKVMRGLRDAMIVQRSSLLGLQADTIDVETVTRAP